MSQNRICVPRESWKRRLARVSIVLAGIVLGQVILYGPSLAGRKVLLPLDLLAQPGMYFPGSPDVARSEAKSPYLVDLVFLSEPARRFAASELHAGRLPLWAPYGYAGAPFVWPKFSPFLLFQCCTESPVVLAWAQLLMALVAGLGAYLFFGRVLGASFWPATIAAWCYPLTAFFVLWQGYPTSSSVVWFPWLLLAVDGTVARGEGQGARGAPIGLAIVTCLVLVSGHLDVAGQVLLGSGLYGLWRLRQAKQLNELHGLHEEAGLENSVAGCEDLTHCKEAQRGAESSFPLRPSRLCGLMAFRSIGFGRASRRALMMLAVGWALGFLLAAPYLLPLLEYTQTSARLADRSAGKEERSPVGLAALPQVVLPKMYGLPESGSFPIFPKGQTSYMESSAAAYIGVFATLFLAPLAWCSRRHRSLNLFWFFLILLGLSWCLNVPGFVHLLRLPGLNMMSHNRLVFGASFALLALAATGLDVLLHGPRQWQRWFCFPAVLLAALCLWCVYRTVVLPEPVDSQLAQAILQAGDDIPQGHQAAWVHDLNGVQRVQAWFVREYAAAALLCGIAVAAWCLLWSRESWLPRLVPALGLVLMADLLWFGWGRRPQCDPALYYPPVPVLAQVAKAAPGRVIGCDCLPANLAWMCGLRDARGYDGVDPARLVELEMLAADPRSTVPDYARTQWLIPRTTLTSGGDVQLSPILDMLAVRYLIFGGLPDPRTHPAFQGPDYWVLVNPDAMPRAYIPRQVEMVADNATRLRKLASSEFDPRDVAYLESPVDLSAPGQGTVDIVEEIPTRVTLSFRAETRSLVVLADLWDKGWRAYLNGQRVPVLRANHALRGVVVPAGTGTLEFRYQPASFAWGLRFAAVAAAALLAWLRWECWRSLATD